MGRRLRNVLYNHNSQAWSPVNALDPSEQGTVVLSEQTSLFPLSFYIMTLSFINKYDVTNHLQGAHELLFLL